MSLHIAFNGWFWDQPFTGSGQYTRELIKALLKVDPSLKITLILPDQALPGSVPDGVSVISVNLPVKGHLGKVWFEQQGFPNAAQKCGAVISHVPYWGTPLNSPGARLIVTIHDVIPLTLPVYQGGLLPRLYTSLVTAGVGGVAHILTDSEFSKKEILEWIDGVTPEQVTAIPLAVSDAMHPRIGRERDPEVRKKYQLPDQYALYIGSFDVRKNITALLAAYTYVKSACNDDFPLILAGKPPAQWGTERFPDIPAEITRLGLEDVVRLIGPVDEEDKPSLYRMARASIYPNRYEGFGLGVLESMACGTPVVAADLTSFPEVAGSGAYLVNPLDARLLGGAIIGALIKEQLHDHLVNEGLARATNFSWVKTATATLEVYRKVATQ
jgi:glycosyltransferase involved in cell wall biosynthesis